MSTSLKIIPNIPLKNYTTFKIGGVAKFFVVIKELEELKQVINWARQENLPFFVLGSGSNLLVSDNGFNGLVIKIENQAFVVKENLVNVGAGLPLNILTEKGWQKNLIGLENLAGIPSTVGGAVRGNAGAFGSQFSDFIHSVTTINQTGEVINFNTAQCQFGYRESIFKKQKDLIIWSVELKLLPGDAALAQKQVQEILQKRWQSQPNLPSAGCIFKNIKDVDEFIKNNPQAELPEKFLINQAIPAAWLIEQAGLKGQSIGNAQISDLHANFIVNAGNVMADDVIKLISLIKTKIRDQFKVQLVEEIELVGF